MDVSPLHIFSMDIETVMQTWSNMTNKWIMNNFILLVSMWPNLSKGLKLRLLQYTKPLIEALCTISINQSPQSISDYLINKLSECSKVAVLEPSVIVALSLADGAIFSSDIHFSTLQMLACRISTNSTFPHLLALLSPPLIDCTIQIDPHKLCKRSEFIRINSILEENLIILRVTDLPNSLVRALLVNLTRVAYWLTIEALIINHMDYFSVSLEFLFHVYSSCSHSANIGAQFLTSYMFTSLRAFVNELQDSENLSLNRITEEIFRDISATSQHLSCILSENTLMSVVSSLFKDLIALYAFKSNVPSEQLTDLLKLVYLERNVDATRAWIKFWLVNDPNGIPMDSFI